MSSSWYEDTLGRVEQAPLAVPRHAASVVLWRRRADGDVEIFWARRSRKMRFMGGWHSFPGGGWSVDDASLGVVGEPAGLDSASVNELTPGWREDAGEAALDGLAACALRELFEETGVLLAKGLEPPAIPRLRAARMDLEQGRTDFAGALSKLGVTLDPGRLVYAGRWITPPLSMRRFDTRFFLTELRVTDPGPGELCSELEDGEWIRPLDALDRWKSGLALLAQPTLHIVRTLAEQGLPSGLERLQRPGEKQPGSLGAIEFRPTVTVVPQRTLTLPPATHTNAFLLGGHDLVLVDPGSSDSDEIARLNLAIDGATSRHGGRVREIWLTHHHRDHIGGVEEMRTRLGAPLRAHEATARRLADQGIAVDDHLVDDEIIELAGNPPTRVRVLHTPGHAQGHLCFFDETDATLIAGDMLASGNTIVIDPPEGDMTAYLDSLERLERLQPRFVFPSHGAMIADGAARFAALRKHRLWREERVLEAWSAGAREPRDFLPTVYEGLEEQALPLAERQVVAHLERLRTLGRLTE